MANIPLSPEDCHRAAQATRRHAIFLLLGDEQDRAESALLNDLAGRFEAAARNDSLPPAREDRWNPAWPRPQQVDTFKPADPAAWGDSPHDQEPTA